MGHARLCHDHLAGTLGVKVFDQLAASNDLAQRPVGLGLAAKGQAFLASLAVELASARKARALLCHACLGRIARRLHLGGPLGRVILAAFETQAWLIRHKLHRALAVTPKGLRGFAQVFPLHSTATPLDLARDCP
jgi:hypothetical protein